MKKVLAVLLCGMLVLTLGACGGKSAEQPDEPVELIVFAAASLTETLSDIGGRYVIDHPEVTIRFSFESSGTLKTQIEEGADCDIFISAGQKQMNQLDADDHWGMNPEGLDFVDPETRFNILENKVALCVADNSDCGITSYDDLAKALQAGTVKLAMGNSDVPVGQYTQKILGYYSLDEAALAQAGCITYGSNAKEVTTQVSEGTVDCGIIYATDAFSAGLDVVDTATAQMCGQVVYPAAIMKNAPQPAAAADFIAYLKTKEAAAIFESVGFTPLAQ